MILLAPPIMLLRFRLSLVLLLPLTKRPSLHQGCVVHLQSLYLSRSMAQRHHVDPAPCEPEHQRGSRKEAVASKKGKIGSSQEEGDGGGRHKKRSKPHPNAFVSVRIPSVEIEDKLREVQEEMIARNQRAESVMVSLKKLHVTLMVLRLEGEKDIERARGVLEEATLEASSTLGLVASPLILEFSGIGSFGKRVVFATLKDGPSRDRLASIAAVVHSTFERHGFPSTDKREFNPHLTVAKVSQRGLTHIDKELYEIFADSEIGHQEIPGLELLSMVEPQASDGYYHCLHRCLFAGDSDVAG